MSKPSVEEMLDEWLQTNPVPFLDDEDEDYHRDSFRTGFLACLQTFSDQFESNPQLTKRDVALLIVDLMEQLEGKPSTPDPERN